MSKQILPLSETKEVNRVYIHNQEYAYFVTNLAALLLSPLLVLLRGVHPR